MYKLVIQLAKALQALTPLLVCSSVSGVEAPPVLFVLFFFVGMQPAMPIIAIVITPNDPRKTTPGFPSSGGVVANMMILDVWRRPVMEALMLTVAPCPAAAAFNIWDGGREGRGG